MRGLVGKPPKHPGREAGKAKLAAYEDLLQRWQEEPIFAGSRTGESWGRGSYRQPWERARHRAAEKLENPKLEKMVFHDWRNTLKTRVINAGLPEILAAKIMGHKAGSDMNALYYVAEIEQVKRALSTLSLRAEHEVRSGVQ